MPRQFPTTGFEVIGSSCLVEEEEWEWYKPEEFYPVRIGEVFKSRYQVVGKLGYGQVWRIWHGVAMPGSIVRHSVTYIVKSYIIYYTARDHKHVTLKIGTLEALGGELRALRYIRTIKTNHPGSFFIRKMLDEFQVDNKNGKFVCSVHPPLAISVKSFRSLLHERALPVGFLKLVLKHLLISLDFLHSEAKVIHTGTSNRIQ
jgi:serine/threonine-protein kinase SRPK3